MFSDIGDYVLGLAKQQEAALEEAVERMLVSPTPCGIAVIDHEIIDLDNLSGSLETRFLLDPAIPFGTIFQFPSPTAYEKWRARMGATE